MEFFVVSRIDKEQTSISQFPSARYNQCTAQLSSTSGLDCSVHVSFDKVRPAKFLERTRRSKKTTIAVVALWVVWWKLSVIVWLFSGLLNVFGCEGKTLEFCSTLRTNLNPSENRFNFRDCPLFNTRTFGSQKNFNQKSSATPAPDVILEGSSFEFISRWAPKFGSPMSSTEN